MLSNVKTMYSRQVFSVMDLISILGGMWTVVFAIGSAIMYLYSGVDQKLTLVTSVF